MDVWVISHVKVSDVYLLGTYTSLREFSKHIPTLYPGKMISWNKRDDDWFTADLPDNAGYLSATLTLVNDTPHY